MLRMKTGVPEQAASGFRPSLGHHCADQGASLFSSKSQGTLSPPLYLCPPPLFSQGPFQRVWATAPPLCLLATIDRTKTLPLTKTLPRLPGKRVIKCNHTLLPEDYKAGCNWAGCFFYLQPLISKMLFVTVLVLCEHQHNVLMAVVVSRL